MNFHRPSSTISTIDRKPSTFCFEENDTLDSSILDTPVLMSPTKRRTMAKAPEPAAHGSSKTSIPVDPAILEQIEASSDEIMEVETAAMLVRDFHQKAMAGPEPEMAHTDAPNTVISPTGEEFSSDQFIDRTATSSVVNTNASNPFFTKQNNNPFTRFPANQAANYGQQSWPTTENSSLRTPAASKPLNPFNSSGEFDPTPSYFVPMASHMPSAFPSHGLSIQKTVKPSLVFPYEQLERPLSPHTNAEWMSYNQQEMDSRSDGVPKRMRPSTPPRSFSPRRDGGIRNKNARFDIPMEQNLMNLDELIANCKTDDELKTLSRITNLNGRYEHWIPAYVNDIKVEAFPDSCSALNIISEDFANQNNFTVDRTDLTIIRLPNRDTIRSSGSLKLKFQFDGEAIVFDLTFTVLPSCICNIILSNEFLQFTKTFTTFKSRIHRWFTPSIRPRPRVCLQGSPKQQVIGSINGHPVSASPDTGSDVNVISKSYAESIGMKIDTNPDAIETLEFIDGSSISTCGIVRNVQWRFGAVPNPTAPAPQTSGDPERKMKNIQDWEYGSGARPASTFLCSFYILKNLSCSIILSADLLYGTNAFTSCAEYFHESISFSQKRQLEDADVCVLKKRTKTMREWVGNVLSKPKTTNYPPSKPIVDEARRRMNELDRIDALPLHQQAAAHEAERSRRHQWTQNNPTQNLQDAQQPIPQPTSPQAASHPND